VHLLAGYAHPPIPVITRPDKKFVYETSCVNANGDDINEMRDHDECREVSYRTMRRRCAGLREWAKSMGYDRWLPLSKDPYVAYYRSFYKGRRCYYLVYSAIEFIWVEEVTTMEE